MSNAGVGVNDKADKELAEGIRQGNLRAVVRALDAGADRNGADQYGYPGLPLRTACFLGHKEIVLELLRRGANPNAANSDGPGAPLRMAVRGKRDEIIGILRQYATEIPEGTLPDLDLPPSFLEAERVRDTVGDDRSRARVATQAITSVKREETRRSGKRVASSAKVRKAPGLSKATREEFGVESVVIGACYGVDTNALNGDLMKFDESDSEDTVEQSGGIKGAADEVPSNKQKP